MSEHVLHTVYWDNQFSGVYMYGSDIRFLEDRSVCFENLMMPAGMVIKEWKSSTVYQADRIEPSLPLLTPGNEYAVRSFYKEEPSGSVFLRFDFYDQQKKKAGTYILDGKMGFFTCPESTYSYTVQLVQGGSDRVHFYRFEIFPSSDKLFYQIMLPKDGEDILSFLIPDMQGRSISIFDEDLPKGITDYMILSPYMSRLTATGFDSILERIAPMDCYDGLCIYLQDKMRYISAIQNGWQTNKRQFRLWKVTEDE